MLCVICHGISHAIFDFSSCFGLTHYITCYITPCLGGHSRVPLQGLHRSGKSPVPHRLGLVPMVLFQVRTVTGPGLQIRGLDRHLPEICTQQPGNRFLGPVGPDGFKI